jgi:hypothetical protein
MNYSRHLRAEKRVNTCQLSTKAEVKILSIEVNGWIEGAERAENVSRPCDARAR